MGRARNAFLASVTLVTAIITAVTAVRAALRAITGNPQSLLGALKGLATVNSYFVGVALAVIVVLGVLTGLGHVLQPAERPLERIYDVLDDRLSQPAAIEVWYAEQRGQFKYSYPARHPRLNVVYWWALVLGVIAAMFSASLTHSPDAREAWQAAGAYAVLLTAVLLHRTHVHFDTAAAEKRQCPDCAEVVSVRARVCKHCGYRWKPPLADDMRYSPPE